MPASSLFIAELAHTKTHFGGIAHAQGDFTQVWSLPEGLQSHQTPVPSRGHPTGPGLGSAGIASRRGGCPQPRFGA